jgi:hypothetical protein
VVKNVDAAGLRIARMAYVMRYSLGTLAHMMRTRQPHARALRKNGSQQRALLWSDASVLHSETP